jgi:hypothetical protein
MHSGSNVYARHCGRRKPPRRCWHHPYQICILKLSPVFLVVSMKQGPLCRSRRLVSHSGRYTGMLEVCSHRNFTVK